MEVMCKVDLKPLIAESEKARKALRKAFGEMIDLANWTFERLIELTPKSAHSKEGKRIADHWELKYLRYRFWTEIEWAVMNDHEVIEYLEYGTHEHWIYPKSPGGVLHWIDPRTGEDHFSKGHLVLGIKPGFGMTRITARDLERELRKLRVTTAMKISN